MATDWGGLASIILTGVSGLAENLFGESMEGKAEEREKRSEKPSENL